MYHRPLAPRAGNHLDLQGAGACRQEDLLGQLRRVRRQAASRQHRGQRRRAALEVGLREEWRGHQFLRRHQLGWCVRTQGPGLHGAAARQNDEGKTEPSRAEAPRPAQT